jgi:hypothetical protein
VLGGTLAVLGIELLVWIFPHFADAISVSQARRAAGFVPFTFAFGGGAAVLARLLGPLVLPAALAAGIGLQLAFPGDFGPGLEDGGPAAATWIAAIGGLAAVVVGFALRRRIEARGWIVPLAAALFCIPVAVHGFRHWTPADDFDSHALTPGLLSALRTDVPKRAIVFSDLETSYRISAFVPVYVVGVPPAHVADTTANRPTARKRSIVRFFRTGDLSIPTRYGADWLVVDDQRFRLQPAWTLVYSDERYSLYHRPE